MAKHTEGPRVMEAGTRATFNYPQVFKTLPEYTAHAGQTVTVVRQLTEDETDVNDEVERMFKVRADDGWEGDAFESELEAPAAPIDSTKEAA